MAALIYIGDKVIVSSRWAGGAENPLKGKTGKVVKIEHGLQSIFNHAYMAVGIQSLFDHENNPVGSHADKGYYNVWQYTLDLEKRSPSNVKLFNSGRLFYIDDFVEISDVKHPRFRTAGYVRGICKQNNKLMYEIRDKAYVNDMTDVQKKWADILNSEVQKKLDEPNSLENFLADIKKKLKIESSDPKVDDLLIEQFDLKEVYPMIVRQGVVDKMETLSGYVEYAKALETYKTDSVFSAELDSIKLIDRFPSNKNFKI